MEGILPLKTMFILPMYHIYGLNYIMMLHLYNQSPLHILPGFEPVQFLTTIQEKKVREAFRIRFKANNILHIN